MNNSHYPAFFGYFNALKYLNITIENNGYGIKTKLFGGDKVTSFPPVMFHFPKVVG